MKNPFIIDNDIESQLMAAADNGSYGVENSELEVDD